MTTAKYDNLFHKNPKIEGKFAERLIFFSQDHVGDKDFSLLWNCITEPYLMAEEPHAHDFDQFLHFYSGDSLHINEFNAEVELFIGEEGERHLITETCVVHIPKNTIHCPLRFVKVDKPVIFMNVALTPHYIKPKP